VVVAGVMVAVLSWLTVALVQLDRDERVARQEASVHERLRLALWRMDSWLSPQLARENLRPASDYAAFPAAGNAWTKGFSKIAKDQVLTQSPLLGVALPLFPIHFELRAKGLCSPQVPVGNERDIAEASGVASSDLEKAKAQLIRLEGALSDSGLRQKVVQAEAQLPLLGCNTPMEEAQYQQEEPIAQSINELDNRQRNFLNVANDGGRAYNSDRWMLGENDTVGPMVPVWVGDEESLLVFARRVQIGGAARVQGVLVDWEQMQANLLALLPDLFEPGSARIVRCEDPTAAEQPSMLATVPARLVADFDQAIPDSNLPVTAILWVTWGVTLLGLVVLGFTLRAALGFGERRARFASAVTHELRTPLTTFRMYSEMLADGIVKDPSDQQHYLKTLQRESDRLARVVENVLAWSRLEDGRFTARRQRIKLVDLVEHVTPAMSQRLAEVAMTLDVEVETAARDAFVETDEDAVGQILFNIVDNAAKYAASGPDSQVRLRVTSAGGSVCLTLCDDGPGIAAEHRRGIFSPFDRGAVRDSANDMPGVGLGLPLARGLARDLGGDLLLDAEVERGACFTLQIPVASS